MALCMLLLMIASSADEYGEYFLWKNFGGSFADYSGNEYHAYNGAEIGEDVSDTVHTDRGAYFNGGG